MKKFSKVTRSLIAIIICFTMMMGFASCQKPGNESNKAEITFDMQISASEITKGSDVSVFGVVKGSEDISYEVVVKNVNGSDGASYIDIVSNGALYTLKVNKNVSEEKQVVVEGYPNAKPDLVKSSTLTIKANVSGSTTIEASMVSSKNSVRKTYVRKGDEVELNVVLSTTDKDKSYRVDVENPSDMPNLVTVGEDNKVIVNGDVTENKKVTITVVSNANPAVKKSFQITVKPPKTAGAVGNLKQETLDKLGNLKLAVKGTLSDVETKNGVKSESVYDFTTYLNATATKQENEQGLFDDYVFSDASWTSEWNIHGNKNVLSNTYVRSDDGLTQKRFVNKNNKVVNEVVTDSYSNELTWESQRYWNHLGYLDLSLFEQDSDDENLYTYEMEYGTIDTDIILGNTTYTPSEDEYLMMYLAWSLTPILNEQFYKFALRLDEEGNVAQIIGSTYENNLYDYDDDGNRNNVIGSYYTSVVMEIEAYGDDVSAPEVKPYEEPADAEDKVMFGYLKTALDNLAKADKSNYTFKVKDTSTYAPSYDPSDYTPSGGEGSAPTTSASGTWDGKVHTKPFTSTEGEVGYMGVVAADGVLLNKTIEYSNGGYRTDVYGFKQNGDNTYEQFEYSGGKLVGKSRKTGNVSSRLPGFDVSPYVFAFSSMTSVDGDPDGRLYSYSLKDSVIVKEVASEFCMKDYANYATSDAKQALSVNVYYNRKTKEIRLVGVTFAYNIIDTYYGYYNTEYSNFGTSVLPADLFSAENYVTKEYPTSWSYFEAEYRATNTADAEKTNAQDLLNRVFGTNAATGKAAADAIPSPMVFSSIFADNFSSKVFHDYFNTGDKNSQGYVYKPEVKFNVWLDDVDLDSNRGLSLKKYNEVIDKLSVEMEKCGFTDYEAGYILKEGTSSKTRQKCYINDNAGDHGLIIRVENIGYKTFYIHIYAKGDWNPSK